MMETIAQYIPQALALFGGGGLGWLFTWRSARRKARAEAEGADLDNRTRSYDLLLHQLETALANNDSLLTRLSEANRENLTLSDRNRELSNRMWQAEQEVNRVNDRNHTQGERLTHALLEVEHLRHWHCRRHDCADPRGREPKQDPPESRYTPFAPPEGRTPA